MTSPKFVKEFLTPRYRKNSDLLRSNGVELIVMDCDGNVEELLPIWIECGIDGIYPLECASGMDAIKVREKFGKDVVIIGNIDKRALAAGKKRNR
jgi:uroporphyrinogen decarboxylase